MDFNEYQKATRETAMYPTVATCDGRVHPMGVYYCAMGLGEVGEIQNKVKKVIRDHNGTITPEFRGELLKEVGDVLYYLASMCHELDSSLEDVAVQNVAKLRDRKIRGVIKGSGDNR